MSVNPTQSDYQLARILRTPESIAQALATQRAEAIAKTKEKAAISLLKPFISGTPMATFIRQRMKEIRDLTEAEIMGKEKAHE